MMADKLPRKNGQQWTIEDIGRLTHLYNTGNSFISIAYSLERTEYAIHCKLTSLGLDINNRPSYSPPRPTITTTIKKETIVNRTVTVKTFIGDQPASNYGTEDLIRAIEKEDEFIVRLRKISVSAAVSKLIKKHLENLTALNSVLEASLMDAD